MSDAGRMKNPFQSADLGVLPWWRDVVLFDAKNSVFDGLAGQLEQAFDAAIEQGSLRRFSKEYRRITGLMIAELPDEPLLRAIVGHSFPRLVNIYSYLRQRRRSAVRFIGGNSSIVRWQLDLPLLAGAVEQTAHMERTGVTHQDFDLKSAPELRRWIYENYWPLVRRFCGHSALPVTQTHLRCLSSEKNGSNYRERFQHHHFGNHHFDQDVYSLPLIIYLSEVSSTCGPFEYLADSDRYATNFVLKAFHQSLNHDCGISSLDETNFAAIGRLPHIFRGGDVLGNLYPLSAFENAVPVTVNGGIGTAVLFDGFNVMHAGGFPEAGVRKSLFVNFRFPVAKLLAKGRLLLAN